MKHNREMESAQRETERKKRSSKLWLTPQMGPVVRPGSGWGQAPERNSTKVSHIGMGSCLPLLFQVYYRKVRQEVE